MWFPGVSDVDGKLPFCRADVTMHDWVSSRLQEEENLSYSVPCTPSPLHKEHSSQRWGWGGRMIKGAWNCSLGGALCEVTPGSEPTSPRRVVGAEGWGLSPGPGRS